VIALASGFASPALRVCGELSPLALPILTTAIMIVVAVWETISLRPDRAE